MSRYTVTEIEPFFISITDAAKALGAKPMRVMELCDDGALDSHYEGKRRVVSVASLNEYAERMKTA